MGQKLTEDRSGSLQRNSTSQVQLNLSAFGDIRTTIGGGQFYTSNSLLLNTGGTGFGGLDAGALGVFQIWYVHLVLNGTTPALVASLSKTAPTGFTSFIWTGWIFVTNSSSQVAITANNTTWDWISYGTATDFTGFGTPTSIEMQGMREGPNWIVRCKFVSGVGTAVEARVAIPFVSADTTKIPSIQNAGAANASYVGALTVAPLIEPSKTYSVFSYQTAGSNGLAKVNGDGIGINGNAISFSAKIPVQGWSNVL